MAWIKEHKAVVIGGVVLLVIVVYFMATASGGTPSAAAASATPTATTTSPGYAVSGGGGGGGGGGQNLSVIAAALAGISQQIAGIKNSNTVAVAAPVYAPPTTTTSTQTSSHPVASNPAPAQTVTQRYYTVQSGNNLTQIANAQGLGGNWQAIYNANRNLIGSNPNLIYPGQKLLIP